MDSHSHKPIARELIYAGSVFKIVFTDGSFQYGTIISVSGDTAIVSWLSPNADEVYTNLCSIDGLIEELNLYKAIVIGTIKS